MADDDKSPKDTAVTNEEAKAEETPKAVAAKEETKTEVSAKEEKKETPKNDKCIACGKKASIYQYVARQY